MEDVMEDVYVPNARLPSGYTVTFSGTTRQELYEESESKTKIDHHWAWAADTDTEGEDEPEDEPVDLAVADHPAVADPDDVDFSGADPDVTDFADSQVADEDTADSAVASPVVGGNVHPW